jgi:hypothetical protein
MTMDPKLFCERMEQNDDMVYASCKTNFEKVLHQMADHAKAGETDKMLMDLRVLRDNYNNMADGCKELSKHTRRALQGVM